MRTFLKMWEKILRTWVFPGVPVHCVLHQLGSSQLPLLSVGVVQPPLSPDWTKTAALLSLSLFTASKMEKDQVPTLTHRELKLIIFISSHERPPAFDSLLLEDGHHGHLCLICHHLNGALFGSLSTAWESVEVELDCTLGEKNER